MPERGWTAELGWKQGFGNEKIKGFLDVALFRSDYQDMIEFTFLGLPNIGFVPLNVGNTSISGAEVGWTGQFQLGKIPINAFGGYTFIQPVYKNFDESDILRSSVSSSDTSNILKYRSRHQFKVDMEAKISKFRWGVSLQYASHFVNIDRAFERPLGFLGTEAGNIDLFGIRTFRENNNSGFFVLDTRWALDLKRWTFSILVNNILNQNYTLRPALLEAPRTFGVRMDYKL
jgi:iron complex outermembrane receptor protein